MSNSDNLYAAKKDIISDVDYGKNLIESASIHLGLEPPQEKLTQAILLGTLAANATISRR